MKGDWIRPDEGLPEEYTNVLVWYEYRRASSGRKAQAFGVTYYAGHGIDRWSSAGLGMDVRILAWMPLPDEPEEKTEPKKYAPMGQEENWA